METALAVPGLTGLANTPEARARLEAGATAMAREFAEATAAIRAALGVLREQGDRLHAAFAGADSDRVGTFNRFDVDVQYDGRRVYRHGDGRDDYAGLFNAMRRKAWELLIDHLGVKNVMSVARRKKFEAELAGDDLPPIDERTIVGVILGLVGQADEFARDAAREVFDLLRPAHGEYKTNSPFRVGRRVILRWWVDLGYGAGKFRPSYTREAEMRALDGVFHLLDGRGVVRGGRTPLMEAIGASPDGKGETDFFRFRCFRNRNLHLEFRRLDLVKQLNGLAAGEYVLGADGD